MAIIKKAIHISSCILYVLIGVYTIVCIPLLARYHPLIVLSGSMEPSYRKGSVLYYKTVPFEDLRVGDVITYAADHDKYVSHRIVDITNGLIETKGDANNISDVYKIRIQDVKGKVAHWSIPYVGYYIQLVNQNLVVVVVFSIIILVSEFLLSNTEAFDINRKNRRSEKNEEI